MRSRRGTVALAFLALTLALSSGAPLRAQAPALPTAVPSTSRPASATRPTLNATTGTRQVQAWAKTKESDFSPTPVPGGGLSVVRFEADGTQRLWKLEEGGPRSRWFRTSSRWPR